MDVKSSSLTEKEIRKLFRAMHEPGSSTRNLVTSRYRREVATQEIDAQNDGTFLTTFDDTLDENFEIAKEVMNRMT